MEVLNKLTKSQLITLNNIKISAEQRINIIFISGIARKASDVYI